jgi:hypothetical protein
VLEIARQIMGLMLIAAPALLLVAMSVSLAGQRGTRVAVSFFGAAGVVLGAIYLYGMITVTRLATGGHGGQAAMGTVAMMAYAYLVIVIAFVIRCRLGFRKPQ